MLRPQQAHAGPSPGQVRSMADLPLYNRTAMMLRLSGVQVKKSGRAVHSSARRGRAALASANASSGAPVASSATASCGISSTRRATLLTATDVGARTCISVR